MHAPEFPVTATIISHGRTTSTHAALIVAVLLSLGASPARADSSTGPWTGEWQTYWRDGGAILTLTHAGDDVRGTYEPGGGRIEGRVEGSVLRGTWTEDERSGGFIFALNDEADTFIGRYDSGEYWNGEKLDGRRVRTPFASAATPRETLRTVLAAANLALYEREIVMLPLLDAYLIYEPPPTQGPERRRRRSLLLSVFDMSTLRINDAPDSGSGREARFEVGPVDAHVRYGLRFTKSADDRWRLIVDAESTLTATVGAFLDALGAESVEDVRLRQQRSPRGAMRDFLMGAYRWNEGGAATALATLDLSFLPEELRSVEGPILAEYLRRILDRAGYVLWQEVPDDPNQATPYVHYRHPAGDIVIERVDGRAGSPPRWLFSARTLQDAPTLFSEIQALPPAAGLTDRPALTPYFEVREALRHRLPMLVRRDLALENWQWLVFFASFAISLLAGWLAGRLADKAAQKLQSLVGADVEGLSFDVITWPVRVAVAGLVATEQLNRLAILAPGFQFLYWGVKLTSVIGVTWLLFLLVDFTGRILLKRAELTPGYADEIVTSLATGLAQLGVVVAGLLVGAEIVDLPYEGVLTGLGVGGVALAFAARETVANMLGGAILLADRPFRRGDLLEADGDLGFVQSVGLRSTRLKRLDDTVLIIPNAQLSDKAIVNWGLRRRRRVQLTIRVLYGTEAKTVTAFVEALKELFLSQDHADPNDCYIALADFAAVGIEVEFRGFFRVDTYSEQVAARHALIAKILELADRMRVRLALPTHIEGDVEEWRP